MRSRRLGYVPRVTTAPLPETHSERSGRRRPRLRPSGNRPGSRRPRRSLTRPSPFRRGRGATARTDPRRRRLPDRGRGQPAVQVGGRRGVRRHRDGVPGGPRRGERHRGDYRSGRCHEPTADDLRQPWPRPLERTVSAPTTGRWSYRVEGWSDPYGTWHHDAAIKVAADVDTEMMLEEGARVLERAIGEVRAHPGAAAPLLRDAIGKLRNRDHSPGNRLGAGISPWGGARTGGPAAARLRHTEPGLPMAGGARTCPLRGVVRVLPPVGGRAFDESTGLWRSGTLRTAAERLDAVAGNGFRRHLSHPRCTRSARSTARARTTPWSWVSTIRARRMPSVRPRVGTTPSTRNWARSRTSITSSPGPARSGSRWHWTWRCSARRTTRG